MSNLRLVFPFLRLCLTNRREVLKNLYNFTLETKAKNLAIKRHNLPQGVPTVSLLELFPDFEETVRNFTYLQGGSGVVDIAILKLLARRCPEGRYLEYGSWRGESISNVAEVMRECISVSFSEQQMKEVGATPNAIRVARLFSKGLPNINHIGANSQTYDFKDLKGTCDLVFVDADHRYEGVRKDTETAFTLLKDEKSVIIWHDMGYGLEGEVNWQVQAGILDGAPNEAIRKRIYRISNSLCGIYTQQTLTPYYPEMYVPDKTFEVKASATPFTTPAAKQQA